MHIAINHRFGAYAYQEGYAGFTTGIANAMSGQCPGDRFFLLADQAPEYIDTAHPNMEWTIGGPPARHPLLWKYWYDIKLPRMLRQTGAEVLLSPDGFCSLRTRVPQVMVIHDLAFLHYPQFLPKVQQWYYRYYTPAFIRKASRIITVSEFSKADILRHYPSARGRVEVVYNAADPAFRPLEWEERESVKKRFTDGREYFICVGSLHPRKNLVNLLKGFSAFKKRQQSNMKLVITGRMAWHTEAFTEALQTFRFRDDVTLTGYLPRQELAALTGAAYALVYPSLWEGFGLPVLEAMQSGVPVLASDNSALPEVAGGAALYFDPTDPVVIGERMMLIYKEEGRRRDMAALGRERAAGFSWDGSAARVREILGDAVKG
jgi:glycosyltransferase involved in cell wall biosynthesis